MADRFEPDVSTGWTRTDWIGLLARLTDGFVRAIPAGGSPAAACLPGHAEPDRVPRIEGFARMSVAWAAWLHEPSNPAVLEHRRRRHDVAALLARGLADATDAAHPAWWGPIGHRDQRIVEAAEVATTLLLGGGRLLSALSDVEPGAPGRVLDWISQVDGRDVWPDNWVLFPMTVGLARRAQGRPVPDAAIDDAIDWMLAHHVGDGWSSDGAGHALDLYSGWAIHWHLLWWARFDGDRRPGRRALIVRRARAWLAGAAPLVAADGAYPRFGRSLGYRFAFAAPFAQAAFLGVDPLEPGVARRLTSGVIRRAVDGGAIDPGTDWLRVGVGAERPAVVEGYVTPGAIAWAAHAFLALAMPATHPFWTTPEAALPADRGVAGSRAAGRARLLAAWTAGGDTRLHNARSGHPADIPGHGYAATYGKLAYRSAFACDVPVASGGSAGSDDAVTAIEPADVGTGANSGERIVHRGETDGGSAGPGWIVARYRLATTGGDVALSTAVLVLDEAEIRISLVGRCQRGIRIRDGGPVLDGPALIEEAAGGAVVLGSAAGGLVGTRPLLGDAVVRRIDPTAERANLVHEPAPHLAAEEIAPATMRRIVATAHIAVAAPRSGRTTTDASGAAALLAAIRVEQIDPTAVVVTAPGLTAIVDLAGRPADRRTIAGHVVRGPGLRVLRAAPDGSSFGGERLAAIDGVLALDRPGIASVTRTGVGIAATVEAGFRVEPGWAGRPLRYLSARRGRGPFEGVATVDVPGVVPDRVVRRLARAEGTHLVELRLEEQP